MSLLDAAEKALQHAGKPLRAKEITEWIIQQHLWTTTGKTPDQTLHARIAVDIKQNGPSSPFVRTEPGVFALRNWGSKEHVSDTNDQQAEKSQVETRLELFDEPKGTTIPQTITGHTKSLSFTDAAEEILRQVGSKKPMHYKAVTEKALEQGLITTHGRTPAHTMYAQILAEISRNLRRGEVGRFVKQGKGLVGLTAWVDYGLAHQIEQHNEEVRNKLRHRLFSMNPVEFEELIGNLLRKIGFEVEVTSPSHDGGIDVRGTLIVASVIRTHMAVQAKRWKQKHNVQAPTVRELRGSLNINERGLIITTSDFSEGAREEADQQGRAPVALMNGEELVVLLVEHKIGVTWDEHRLLKEAPFDLVDEQLE